MHNIGNEKLSTVDSQRIEIAYQNIGMYWNIEFSLVALFRFSYCVFLSSPIAYYIMFFACNLQQIYGHQR